MHYFHWRHWWHTHHHKECRAPPLTLLMTHTKGGVTLTGEIMDITLHAGGREFFQLSGKDAEGDPVALTGATLNEVTSDPHIATVTANPADATNIAIDGITAGSCTIGITLTNPDGVAAQPVTLNITVLAGDVTEVDVEQVGTEVPAGTPFPGASTLPGSGATGATGP